jgi:hypothetical protein
MSSGPTRRAHVTNILSSYYIISTRLSQPRTTLWGTRACAFPAASSCRATATSQCDRTRDLCGTVTADLAIQQTRAATASCRSAAASLRLGGGDSSESEEEEAADLFSLSLFRFQSTNRSRSLFCPVLRNNKPCQEARSSTQRDRGRERECASAIERARERACRESARACVLVQHSHRCAY